VQAPAPSPRRRLAHRDSSSVDHLPRLPSSSVELPWFTKIFHSPILVHSVARAIAIPLASVVSSAPALRAPFQRDLVIGEARQTGERGRRAAAAGCAERFRLGLALKVFQRASDSLQDRRPEGSAWGTRLVPWPACATQSAAACRSPFWRACTAVTRR
jgi:hypothetical protein